MVPEDWRGTYGKLSRTCNYVSMHEGLSVEMY